MGEGLSDVFLFYIEQLGKLIDILRQIPVFENISLFHTLIALCVLSIFFKIIKYGYNEELSLQRSMRRSDILKNRRNKKNKKGE